MHSQAAQKARIFLHRGDLDQARHWYEQAVQAARSAEDGAALADSLGNLGNVYALCGRSEEADSCYRELLVIQRERQDQLAIGQTLVNLGNLQKDAGRFGPARAHYMEALD